MDESKANAIAELLGGYAWNSGGGIYLVVIDLADGARIVISDEVVSEYRDDESMENGEALATIRLI